MKVRGLRVSFVALLFLVTTSLAPASAAQHLWGASYLNWSGALLSETSSVSQVIQPLELSSNMYWEAGWVWDNAKDGAYGGIQTNGYLANGQIADLAIFSIWNATSAIPGPDAGCLPFGGEGIGYSCQIATPMVAGNKYEISFSVDVDRGPKWWKATIKDFAKGTTKVIGSIEAPSAGLKTTNWNNFIEYWGQAVPCDAVGMASARFYVPTSNNSDVQFHSPYFSRPTKPCVNSAGDTPPDGYIGDAVIRFGGSSQLTSTTTTSNTKSKSLLAQETAPAAAKAAADRATAEWNAKHEAESKCYSELPLWNKSIIYLNSFEENYRESLIALDAVRAIRLKYGITAKIFESSRCSVAPHDFINGVYNDTRQKEFATDVLSAIGKVLDQIALEKQASAAAKAAAAKKQTTITCNKGKLTKKVTGINPKCPSGYVKK